MANTRGLLSHTKWRANIAQHLHQSVEKKKNRYMGNIDKDEGGGED